MSGYLRPAIAMGQWAPKNGGYSGPHGYARYRNQEFFAGSRTPWARFWVSWSRLQPFGPGDPATTIAPYPDWPGVTPQMYVAALDDVVVRARQDGRRVILTLRDCPNWANPQTRAMGNPDPARRFDPWAPPDNVGHDSDWAILVYWLAVRYNVNNGVANRWADVLEVCNEPNLEWWPQSAGLHVRAAQMMETARYITRVATGDWPLIAGPALSDVTDTDSLSTSYGTFLGRMFTSMRNLNFFGDSQVIWTHHSYGDSTHALKGNQNRAADVRRRLRDELGWRGWPSGSTTDVQLFLTEGGANLNHSKVRTTSKQDTLVSNHWRLIQNDANPEAAGIAMITNYLTWSERGFDTGLCNVLLEDEDPATPYPAVPSTGGQRPVYFSWPWLPTTYPR